MEGKMMFRILRVFLTLLAAVTISVGVFGCTHSDHPTGADHPAKTDDAGKADHPTTTDDAGKADHPTKTDDGGKADHPK
jgi:hypothetical protein